MKSKKYTSTPIPGEEQPSTPFMNPEFDTRTNNKSVKLEDDILFIINEHATVARTGGNNDVDLTVIPISYEEYDKLMSKPFKRPVKYQAWRLINYNSGNKSDLIVGPNDTLTSYTIRYVKRPKPIIVGDLDGLTINGYKWGATNNETATPKVTTGECELDPILHEEILQRAVELAKISWTATGQDNYQAMIQAGQRSE